MAFYSGSNVKLGHRPLQLTKSEILEGLDRLSQELEKTKHYRRNGPISVIAVGDFVSEEDTGKPEKMERFTWIMDPRTSLKTEIIALMNSTVHKVAREKGWLGTWCWHVSAARHFPSEAEAEGNVICSKPALKVYAEPCGDRWANLLDPDKMLSKSAAVQGKVESATLLLERFRYQKERRMTVEEARMYYGRRWPYKIATPAINRCNSQMKMDFGFIGIIEKDEAETSGELREDQRLQQWQQQQWQQQQHGRPRG